MIKKIILAPDSFKGSLSSLEICEIGEDSIKSVFPNVKVESIPIADGGEGTMEALSKFMEGKYIHIKSKDLNMNDIVSRYYLSEKTAIIEMANCAGLTLSLGGNNPLKTTTFGVGLQIKDAIEKGAKKIVIGLGGSGTNDGGCGFAAALGVEFYNEKKETFIPVGGNIKFINRIDTSKAEKLLNGVEVIALCDVENTMYGKQGAAYIYGGQKGANGDMIEYLDQNIVHLAKLMKKMGYEHIDTLKGGGSAGAMGAGVVFFANGKLEKGIDVILSIANFEEKVKDADLVITGEGRLDAQSSMGKVISGIGKITKMYKIPLIALCGIVDSDYKKIYNSGVTAVFNTSRSGLPFEKAKLTAKEDYRSSLIDILKLLGLGNKL